jgi:hypothetical protein
MPEGWVIVGQPMESGDGVILLASDHLNEARLREEISLRGGQDITLTLRLPTYLKIRGEDYEDALQRLFRVWRPSSKPADAMMIDGSDG